MTPWLPFIFAIHSMVFTGLYFRRKKRYHAALIMMFLFLTAASTTTAVVPAEIPLARMFKMIALAFGCGSLILRLKHLLCRD